MAAGSEPQDLLIDYVVHHRKADGRLTPKVFKWKTLRVDPRESVHLRRRHPMRPITTRVYYPGQHRLEIQINGATCADADFHLDMTDKA